MRTPKLVQMELCDKNALRDRARLLRSSLGNPREFARKIFNSDDIRWLDAIQSIRAGSN